MPEQPSPTLTVQGTHYDYKNQCWIVNGRVHHCGHPFYMRPGCCYAGDFAGEAHECNDQCH